MKRSEIENKYKWNTDLIYSSMDAFNADFEKAIRVLYEGFAG